MTTKNWFENCITIEEIKKRYRTLAQKHHPDHGGTNEDMAEINSQYEKFRYIKFIDQRCKKDCLLKEQPYPKYYNGD